ncbi:MAG: hypothetical protein CL763_04540 [Chloroflexi bacterium]|nr:hypothetical protein [Chloroflexota bacterium]|tara:strand:- start:7231 stop:8466 length:1236 start_codon:yes stop_codon:yes gene_type:complete
MLIPLAIVIAVIGGVSVFANPADGLAKTLYGKRLNLFQWEVSNFFDKWTYQSINLFKAELNEKEQREKVAEFFQNIKLLNSRKTELDYLIARDSNQAMIFAVDSKISDLRMEIDKDMPFIEEFLESEVSQVLSAQEIIDELGPIHWPPVDFTFESNGLLLVISPRNKIFREKEYLLLPTLSKLEQIAIEDEIEKNYPDLSALVIRIGGVATYPAQVRLNSSLHTTLNLIAHEWLHHWLIFRPLGQKWFAGGELQAINETVANIFAEEIGDAAYESVTGEKIFRKPWVPTQSKEEMIQAGEFNFKREMRKTRIELDRLLADGLIEYSEKYLEERRKLFVKEGYNLRKLNNAWFAFHGSYGNSSASVSPIESQLRMIRFASINLRDFLNQVKNISQDGQLQLIAEQFGWTENK